MEIICLGTSSQKPSPTRNVNSTLLRLRNGHIAVFDCGEGTQHQFLRYGIPIANIEYIFIMY